MSTTPTWQAATSGQPGKAGHVNQFLGTHAATVLYTGVQTAAQTTAGTGSVTTNGTWLAQSFTTAAGQTAVGYVVMQLQGTNDLGANLPSTTVSLYANGSGAPTGSSLVTTTATAEYVGNGPLNLVVPLPATGLTASTTYWIVVAAAGNSTYYYEWNKSNQTSGASTSTNGTTWTAQSYGFLYQVYDQTPSGLVTCMWEDSGARWTWTAYGAQNLVSEYAEYTAGQTASGYLQSFRFFTYSNGLLTGVS